MPTKVLDKGSVELIECMGSDLTVVNCARVSFDSESTWEFNEVTKERQLSERDRRLIFFLARGMDSKEWQSLILEFCSITDPTQMENMMLYFHRKAQHWAPFAHPTVQLRVKSPIFVRTQLFKHKVGANESEVSRRYVDSEPELYTPDKWRERPDKSVKQGSGDATIPFTYNHEAHITVYNRALEEGVAPEQARMVLPQSTYTEWVWTGSLAFFARVYNQRADSHAQWESQQYAHAIGNIMKDLFPVSWEALTG